MKCSPSSFVGLLAFALLVATSFLPDSLHRPGDDRERIEKSDRQHEVEQSPPEDWFITQRATRGGIPREARRKAHDQAAALAAATARLDPRLATTPWQFVGPTNIGGRVLDIAVDPVAADTIYVAAATGGVWKSTDRGAHFDPIWPLSNPQAIGTLVIASNGTLFAGTGEANPGGGSITYG